MIPPTLKIEIKSRLFYLNIGNLLPNAVSVIFSFFIVAEVSTTDVN